MKTESKETIKHNAEMYVKCMEQEIELRKTRYSEVWNELDKVMGLLYNKEIEAHGLSTKLESANNEIKLLKEELIRNHYEIKRLSLSYIKPKSKGELLKESIANQYKKPDFGISYED